MAPKKCDGIVEAVRYRPDGSIQTVRLYERRGATFTDRILLDRGAFVQRLKLGRRFLIGRRLPLLASEFEVGQAVRLAKVDGKDVIVTGDQKNNQDRLEGAPLF